MFYKTRKVVAIYYEYCIKTKIGQVILPNDRRGSKYCAESLTKSATGKRDLKAPYYLSTDSPVTNEDRNAIIGRKYL